MFISEDFSQFKIRFVQQLKAMLADDELGAFILVLANSLQDESLREALADDLKTNFDQLHQRFINGTLQAPADDLAVFKQLLELDPDNLPLWQSKSLGDWELVFNIMRQLRPPRASSQVLNSIIQPFEATKFHFNKAFLKPEILWQGEYANQSVRVLYNKFPFAPYHLLIAIDVEKNHPQVLNRAAHDYIFSLATSVAEKFPGFGVGYNSLAAGASVNHLHFQGFIRPQKFSIEKQHWRHHGNDRIYPLAVRCFTETEPAWWYISQLTKQDRAFNCLYRYGKCYVVQRPYQGSITLPLWLDGAGWIDMAGVVTVSNRDTFHSLDENTVFRTLGQLKNQA